MGYKRRVYRFQIIRTWYLSDRFHGSSSVKGAYRKLKLRENPNLVPRVLSYPSLRHSVGTGRRKPWERGWESPFSLLLILRLLAPVSWLKLVNDLGEIKGVGVKMRGDLSLWVIAWNWRIQFRYFLTGVKIRHGFPLGLLFHSLWSFVIPR